MGATVTVAPREIHDLVYRVSRIAGCDPGTAERIAENVTFAEIHHGAAVRAFCEALGSRRPAYIGVGDCARRAAGSRGRGPL